MFQFNKDKIKKRIKRSSHNEKDDEYACVSVSVSVCAHEFLQIDVDVTIATCKIISPLLLVKISLTRI